MQHLGVKTGFMEPIKQK